MALQNFDTFEFTSSTRRFTVFATGKGPGILLMHELPGITPETAAFAERLAAAGFMVWMPHLFGVPGKEFSQTYAVIEFTKACVSREMNVLAARQSSPIADSLRDLGRKLYGTTGGRGIGAIGLCITGNFALALMADPFVLAPVIAEPSLPLGFTNSQKCGLHISDDQLRIVRDRVSAGTKILGVRFSEDKLCPKQRFARLLSEIAEGFECIEINSCRGNGFGIPVKAHSVFTREFVDGDQHPTKMAFERLISFLKTGLSDTPDVRSSIQTGPPDEPRCERI